MYSVDYVCMYLQFNVRAMAVTTNTPESTFLIFIAMAKVLDQSSPSPDLFEIR